MADETSALLSYLKDLGWTDLYRVPPGSLGAAEAEGGSVEPDEEAPSPPIRGVSPERSSAGGEIDPTPESRRLELERLASEASECRACALCETRKTVVFGSGSPFADLMFIGEGPGANEDRQGLPFVGAAGELLTRIIRAIDLEREEVYIANIVKCRPPNNRDPLPEEVAACRGYLERQIQLVDPRVIVLLGRVAAQTLLGTDTGVGRLRGNWHIVSGVETMVTYHPAALLRNASMKRPVWEDMQKVRDRLRSLA